MLLKSVLNQFERDWAEAPLRDKNLDLSKFINKSIIVSGNSKIARSVVISLLSVNDKLNSNNTIYAFCKEESNGIFDLLRNRSDFVLCNTKSLLPANSDLFIEVLFLENFCNSADTAKDVLYACSNNTEIISYINPAKVILLSDNSVYGELKQGFVISENENGYINYDEKFLQTMIMQSVENMYSSASKQYGFDLSVLRCSTIISDFSKSDFVKSIVNAISKKQNLKLLHSNLKVSYIYINDLLTALFYVIINGENTVYNACSDDATVSNIELAVIINELFDGVNFLTTDDGLIADGCAVCNTKLKQLGFVPCINIKDALLIAVHAYKNSDEVFMFPDAYDGKLETIQKILLGFLLEIDRICKKHNIKYFLAGGTLLGAVRHKGFIPWDDDADVMMLREDYDKFLRVLPSELPSNFTVQNNEKTSHFPFTKIRINDTVFSTEFSSRFGDIHNGIFFDVLAQDQTSNNKLIRKLHMHATASARWLVLDKWRGTKVNANGRFSSFVANVLKTIFPLAFLEKIQNTLMSQFKNKKNAKYLFDSMGRNITRGEFPKQWLQEIIYVDFENEKLPIPKEYDKYLKYLYGDYMEMIPVSQRHVSHDIIQMDLGEYADYEINKK
ncbi:MAG: LicD family protein [Ruminococcus sp.]|nr:LicD family protein [Ruminococcus sp.]